jgi:hypothetical protein
MNEKIEPTKPSGDNGLQSLKDFFSLPLNSRWTTVLIWLLALFILGLNVFVAWLYWTQNTFLAYFDSTTFKALLASVLIPLLMSSISRAFKIGEKVEADKKQLEHAKKEEQYKAIKQTNSMWTDLCNMSTEVAYFKNNPGKTLPRDLRKKLEQFANSAEEVISAWYRNFPRLKPEDTDKFLSGMNTLFLSASSVIEAIERNDAEAEALQNCLLIIQDGVRASFHYPLIMIFSSEMEGRTEEVAKQIAALHGAGEYYRALLKDQEPNFPHSEATQIFSQKRAKIKSWYQQYLPNQMKLAMDKRDPVIPASTETQEYYDAIYKIPFEQLGLARKQPFSTDQMKRLAVEIFFQNDSRNLRLNILADLAN